MKGVKQQTRLHMAHATNLKVGGGAKATKSGVGPATKARMQSVLGISCFDL